MAKKIILEFYNLYIDIVEYGTENEFIDAKAQFKIRGKATEYDCRVIQPHGPNNNFEEDPVEVHVPEELKKKIKAGDMQYQVEKYFRRCIGKDSLNFSKGFNRMKWKNLNIQEEFFAAVGVIDNGGAW